MADSSAGRAFFYGVIGVMITLAVVFVLYQKKLERDRLRHGAGVRGAPSAASSRR